MQELLPVADELMTQDYLAVRPTLPLLAAVAQLEQHAEDTAFVIDDDGRFLGVLTEKECLRTLSARAYDGSTAETVGDAVSPVPARLSRSTDAYTVAQAFLSCSCAVLPVFDHDRIVGAVTQLAMLRAFLNVLGRRTTAQGEVEQTVDDLRGRPESKEQMQRLAANLDRDQLATLFHQSVRHPDSPARE